MKEQKKVQILLSAYNGKKYLREQIDSLRNQTWSNLEILIRDDGSTDGTEEILREYEKQYSNIRVFAGKNIGLVQSFFELLELSDADYIAFCDQDDVWMEEKIEQAVLAIGGMEMPVLYCGNKILVDSNLKEIGISDSENMKPGFGNAVVENIATGCTMVLNRKLVEIIKKRIPKKAILHDWWCYLVASYYGKVIYDKTPYIYYRQHGGNQVGGSAGFVQETKAKLNYLKKSKGKLKAQLMEFHKIYYGNRKKDELICAVLNAEKFSGRISVIFNSKIYRQKKMDNFIVKGLFLTNNML